MSFVFEHVFCFEKDICQCLLRIFEDSQYEHVFFKIRKSNMSMSFAKKFCLFSAIFFLETCLVFFDVFSVKKDMLRKRNMSFFEHVFFFSKKAY